MIVGNGGMKVTAKYQEDPNLDRAVKQLEYVYRRIMERMREGGIDIEETIDGLEYVGNLMFGRE